MLLCLWLITGTRMRSKSSLDQMTIHSWGIIWRRFQVKLSTVLFKHSSKFKKKKMGPCQDPSESHLLQRYLPCWGSPHGSLHSLPVWPGVPLAPPWHEPPPFHRSMFFFFQVPNGFEKMLTLWYFDVFCVTMCHQNMARVYATLITLTLPKKNKF